MNGHIISGAPICVDYWLWTPPKQYVHFLSHLHADHTVSLKSTFCDRIYTSPFNAWLVKRWFKVEPELVVSLELGETHVVYHEPTNIHFSVTLLDANHCPGSVMFIFEGPFGNIVYTGDFRYNPDILEHPILKSLIENEVVHRLYLDNTFAAEHCEFPPRHEALEKLLDLIREHSDHYIFIGVRKLGKEEALRAIALKFQEKVWVTRERLNILSFLRYEDVFTTDENESRIFVKEIHQLSTSYLHRMQEERGPVLAVLLTALYNMAPTDVESTKKTFNCLHHIPYSDHSCHSELLTFVSKLKPHQIQPIVVPNTKNEMNTACSKENNGPSDVSCLSFTWRNSIIPQSILKFCKNKIERSAFCELPTSREGSLATLSQPMTEYESSASSESDENEPKNLKCVTQVNNYVQESSKSFDHSVPQSSKTANEEPDFPNHKERLLPMSGDEFFVLSDDDLTQMSSNSLELLKETNHEKEALKDDLSKVDNNTTADKEITKELLMTNSKNLSEENNQIEDDNGNMSKVNNISDNAVICETKDLQEAMDEHVYSPKRKCIVFVASTPTSTLGDTFIDESSELSIIPINVTEVVQETNILKMNSYYENNHLTEELPLAIVDATEISEPNESNQSYEICKNSNFFQKIKPKPKISENFGHLLGKVYDSDSEGFCETAANPNCETNSLQTSLCNTSSTSQNGPLLDSFSVMGDKINICQNRKNMSKSISSDTFYNNFDCKISKWRESVLRVPKSHKVKILLQERSDNSTTPNSLRPTNNGSHYDILNMWNHIDWNSVYANSDI